MIPGPRLPAFSFTLPPAPSRERIEQLFRVQRATDHRGMPIHDACALLACFFAAWPTSFVEWAGLPVLVCFLIRITGHRHVPGPMLWDPVARIALALAAWTFLSFAWTLGSTKAYVDDVAPWRFALLIPALYPALERRTRLIVAIVAGFLVGQFVQAADVYGHIIKEPWMTSGRAAGRYSGWWDPVVGGSVLCACLGLHAAALATARRWWVAVLALGGVLLTLACIVATGTRGAWIGAAGTLGVAAIVAALRLRPRGLGVAMALIIVGVGVGGAYGAWALAHRGALGPGLQERILAAETEVRRAFDQRDFASDTGMRVAMGEWALLAAGEHPILGVGAGGYQAFADRTIARATPPTPKAEASESASAETPSPETPSEAPSTPPEAAELSTTSAAPLPRPHAHAHSWFLHTLATLGGVGLLLTLALVTTAVLAGLSGPGWSIRRPLAMVASVPRGYAAAPALGIVGLVGAGAFDAITINQQTSYLLWVLVALCLPCRPEPRSDLGRLDA